MKFSLPYIHPPNTGFRISIPETYFQLIVLTIAKTVKIRQQQVSFLDGDFMLFSRLQRNEAYQSRYPFDFIPGYITGYWILYFAHSVPISFPSHFFPYFDMDIRAVIFEGIVPC